MILLFQSQSAEGSSYKQSVLFRRVRTSTEDLPADVLLRIFGHLNNADLCRVRAVCKLYCNTLDARELARRISWKDFRKLREKPPSFFSQLEIDMPFTALDNRLAGIPESLRQRVRRICIRVSLQEDLEAESDQQEKMQELRYLAHVSSLTFVLPRVGNIATCRPGLWQTMTALHALTNLQALIFTASGAEIVRNLSGLTGLSQLRLGLCPILRFDDLNSLGTCLSMLTNLRDFGIETDRALCRPLLSEIQLSQLTRLKQITRAGKEAEVDKYVGSYLKSLNARIVECLSISIPIVTQVHGIASFTKLKDLDLHFRESDVVIGRRDASWVAGPWIEVLNALQGLTHLQLHDRYAKVDWEEFRDIQLTSLKKINLDLYNHVIDDSDVESNDMASFLNRNPITALHQPYLAIRYRVGNAFTNLRFLWIRVHAVQHLVCMLPSLTNLTELGVQFILGATDGLAKNLCKLSNLRVLRLGPCQKLSSKFVECLPGLSRNLTRLSRLELIEVQHPILDLLCSKLDELNVDRARNVLPLVRLNPLNAPTALQFDAFVRRDTDS